MFKRFSIVLALGVFLFAALAFAPTVEQTPRAPAPIVKALTVDEAEASHSAGFTLNQTECFLDGPGSECDFEMTDTSGAPTVWYDCSLQSPSFIEEVLGPDGTCSYAATGTYKISQKATDHGVDEFINHNVVVKSASDKPVTVEFLPSAVSLPSKRVVLWAKELILGLSFSGQPFIIALNGNSTPMGDGRWAHPLLIPAAPVGTHMVEVRTRNQMSIGTQEAVVPLTVTNSTLEFGYFSGTGLYAEKAKSRCQIGTQPAFLMTKQYTHKYVIKAIQKRAKGGKRKLLKKKVDKGTQNGSYLEESFDVSTKLTKKILKKRKVKVVVKVVVKRMGNNKNLIPNKQQKVVQKRLKWKHCKKGLARSVVAPSL